MKKWDVIILILALMLSLALLVANFTRGALETASWGLSYQIPGQPPAGPASREDLAKFQGYYLGNSGEKVLYLTFDAGYENGCTEKILDTLAAHKAPAAFFLAGNYLERNPDLARRMVKEGHIIGNHTMHHPDMSKCSREEFEKELKDFEALCLEKTGSQPGKFYRPPQGIYSQENLEQAASMGYRTVFWSLAYADWDNAHQPEPEAALKKLTGRTHSGAIVLLHSTSKTNAEILDRLLTQWESEGYRLAPLSELGAPDAETAPKSAA